MPGRYLRENAKSRVEMRKSWQTRSEKRQMLAGRHAHLCRRARALPYVVVHILGCEQRRGSRPQAPDNVLLGYRQLLGDDLLCGLGQPAGLELHGVHLLRSAQRAYRGVRLGAGKRKYSGPLPSAVYAYMLCTCCVVLQQCNPFISSGLQYSSHACKAPVSCSRVKSMRATQLTHTHAASRTQMHMQHAAQAAGHLLVSEGDAHGNLGFPNPPAA